METGLCRLNAWRVQVATHGMDDKMMRSARRVWVYLPVVLLICCVPACSNKAPEESGTADGNAGQPATAHLQNEPPWAAVQARNGVDACALLGDVAGNLDTIRAHGRDVFRGEDSCVFALTDTLIAMVRTDESARCLMCLDSLCVHSDGDGAEYLEEAVGHLYHTAMMPMLRYLAYHPDRRASALESMIVSSLRIEIAVSANPAATILAIKGVAHKAETEHEFDARMRKVLRFIVAEAQRPEPLGLE